MKLLAVETSSIACSVALQLDDKRVERHAEKAREHTRLLVPMIGDLLTDAHVGLADLDGLVLGNGPGSFIGLRIAASIVQGMAFSTGLRVIPVSSMLAVATEAFESTDADEIVVAADAHMNEVYLGQFCKSPDGSIVVRENERLHAVGEIESLLRSDSQKRVAAGAGWLRYPALFDQNRAAFDAGPDVLYPRAKFLLDEALRLHASGQTIDPDEIAPTYLRQQVATPSPTS